jgi:cytochrome c-type biogenesis protein
MIEDVTYTACLTAGLLSFFSPCVLPLVPSYFMFIAGASLDQLTDKPTAVLRRKIILSTLAFVAGFSTVFILLGASATYLSGLLFDYKSHLRILGGCLIIVFGLYLMGFVKIRWFDFDKRLHLRQKPLHVFSTFLIGMAFGAGWSPCIGPLLGSILILAGNQDTVVQGVWLLGLYSLGLALPFVALSIGTGYLLLFVRRATKALRYLNIAAGVLLIVTGLLLITDRFGLLASFFS